MRRAENNNKQSERGDEREGKREKDPGERKHKEEKSKETKRFNKYRLLCR